MPGTPALPVRPDAVNIIFGAAGHIVIDHLRQASDIQPPGGHIRCHEGPELAAFEGLEGAGPERLALAAVQGRGTDPFGGQFFGEPVSPVPGAG